MKQVLDNTWEQVVDFLVETSENDQAIKQMIHICRKIAIEKRITIYDAIFIFLYSDAQVNDKNFYRRLN